MKRERKQRGRTRQEKFNDEGDFLIGVVIGTVASFCCGFMLFMGTHSSGIPLLPFLAAAMLAAGVLLLGFHLSKHRGQRLVLHGLVISLLFGLLLAGLCAVG